jgi:hypothetical protein
MWVTPLNMTLFVMSVMTGSTLRSNDDANDA